MINLIPPSALKMVVKEYWLRVLAVWLFLLGTGCLLVASLMLPTYVLLRSELLNLRDQVAANAAETASYDTSSAALSTAMKQAGLLNQATTTKSYVGDLLRISEIGGQGISLQSVSFLESAEKTNITIVGIANTRAALANFRDALENDERFVDATLPISSLIKDKNLEFTMTLNTDSI